MIFLADLLMTLALASGRNAQQKEKEKTQKKKRRKKRKIGHNGVPSETADQKKEMLQENVKQLKPTRNRF